MILSVIEILIILIAFFLLGIAYFEGKE